MVIRCEETQGGNRGALCRFENRLWETKQGRTTNEPRTNDKRNTNETEIKQERNRNEIGTNQKRSRNKTETKQERNNTLSGSFL